VTEAFARERGYDYMENACSHYHVAKWAESLGYRYSEKRCADALSQFAEGLKRIKAAGIKLTRPQESWVVAIQSLPREFIPKEFDMAGPVWPQNNIDQANLWVWKPLSERALAVHPLPVKTKAPEAPTKEAEKATNPAK